MEDYDEGPGTPVKMGHYTVNDTFNFKEDKGVRMEPFKFIHEVVLLASYCDDNQCSDRCPCNTCLMMCNIFQVQIPDDEKCIGELGNRRDDQA